MKLRQAVMGRLVKTEAGRRLVSEQRYRMVLAAGAGFVLNLLYALYHGVLGVAGLSLWFLTMCAYYTVLGVTRFSAVLCEYKNGSEETEFFVMKLTGLMLILLSLVLSGVNYVSLSGGIAAKYGEILMITIATYTFYKITMAAIRAVRQRKNPSPLLAVIRSIGYAEVAASVLTLQRSMLVSFGAMDHAKAHTMNMLTGAAVCLFVLALGVSLIRRGRRRG